MRDIIKRIIIVTNQKKEHILQVILLITYGLLCAFSSLELGNLTQNAVQFTTTALRNSIILFMVLEISSILLNWYRERRRIQMVEAEKHTLRNQVVNKLLNSEYSKVQTYSMGDLINRINLDCESAGEASALWLAGIKNFTIPFIMLLFMLTIEWRAAIAFIIPFPILILWQNVTAYSTGDIKELRLATAEMSSETLDLVSHRQLIKAYNLQQKAKEWSDKTYENYQKKAISAMGKLYSLSIPSLFIGMLPIGGTSIVGGYLLFHGNIDLNHFVTLVMLAQIATGELLNLPNVFVNMPGRLEAARRVFEIWDLPEEQSGEGIGNTDSQNVITFQNVDFQYVIEETEIESRPQSFSLEDFSATIQKGEKIALVGSSGCGKSTIVKLITGLYRSDSIQIWEENIENWDLQALRSNIGFMQQETNIFSGTIYDNIAFGSKEATKEQVVEAAKKAQLLEWIMAQPGKWESQVGEKGSLLSGGLKQRVGLARLFLQDAPLFLLDEPTSALDMDNEQKIMEALREEAKDKTWIMIAHRLSTITDADCIYVMDKGKVLEKGTHHELLNAKGYYASLYANQQYAAKQGGNAHG